MSSSPVLHRQPHAQSPDGAIFQAASGQCDDVIRGWADQDVSASRGKGFTAVLARWALAYSRRHGGILQFGAGTSVDATRENGSGGFSAGVIGRSLLVG